MTYGCLIFVQLRESRRMVNSNGDDYIYKILYFYWTYSGFMVDRMLCKDQKISLKTDF